MGRAIGYEKQTVIIFMYAASHFNYPYWNTLLVFRELLQMHARTIKANEECKFKLFLILCTIPMGFQK